MYNISCFCRQAFVLFLTVVGSAFVANAQGFVDTLPIPPLVKGDVQNLTISMTRHNFAPNGQPGDSSINVMMPAMALNETGDSTMTYLGPTLLWQKGHTIQMNVMNRLPGSDPDVPSSLNVSLDSATTHWHGLNVYSQGDGGPHQSFNRNTSYNPQFPLIDSVQTLWYHSHLMNYTTEQVIWGLAGLIIVEDTVSDPFRSQLPHDYGINDLPVILQEKRFNYDTIAPHHANSMYVSEKPGNGPINLVNGILEPFVRVPNQYVRLRILNGSPRRSFLIGWSKDKTGEPTAMTKITAYQIGTDGSYTDRPYATDTFLVNPGERGEFIIDMSLFKSGDTVYMRNMAPFSRMRDVVLGKNQSAGRGGGYPFATASLGGPSFMAFIIDSTIQPRDPITSRPSALEPYILDTGPIFKKRVKNLYGAEGSGSTWTIDSIPMMMRVLNDTVKVNAKEEWVIKNHTHVAHPFHIHKVQFQVTQLIDHFDTLSPPDTINFADLPPYLKGWKDVVLVRAFSEVTFQARFDSFPDHTIDHRNGYMYHCHILTHEDASMMHQFTVVSDSLYNTLFPIAIENPQGQEVFELFPNPAHDQLHLRGVVSRPGILRFLDLTGRTLYETRLAPFSGTKTLDMSQMPRGLMLVDWQQGDSRMVKKLILR